jgi:DNA-directed RNA polymerase specialized sigma24 family protein
MLYLDMTFEAFAASTGPRLRAGLVAAYGIDVGLDAAAEALAFGWERWDRLSAMANPAGYLYRVGQTSARRQHRVAPAVPMPLPVEVHEFEPGLIPALEQLSELQRVCVLMVHGYGWGATEVAEMLEVSVSTVRSHVARALASLRDALEVNSDALHD